MKESDQITRVAVSAARSAFEEATVTLAETQMASITHAKKVDAATRHHEVGIAKRKKGSPADQVELENH